MKIGYPCSNLTVQCSAARTFRLASYSEERIIETVQQNLDCLDRILRWNIDHDIRFFRISSTTVPFASHPVMTVNWQARFADQFAHIGALIQKHDMRINVHPGQYILINSPKPEVVERSVSELTYHAKLLNLLNLDHTHKIQIHTGGIYGDKPKAIQRFAEQYTHLPDDVRRRLVIENDERQYSLADNLHIHELTGIPLLFDVFHHTILNNDESLQDVMKSVEPTWRGHGVAMVDYSSQNAQKQAGAHTQSINLKDFGSVIEQLGGIDIDLMLEIKDKESSALRALAWVREHMPTMLQ